MRYKTWKNCWENVFYDKPNRQNTTPKTGNSTTKAAQGNEKINSKGGNILIGTQISGMRLEKFVSQ